MEMQVTPDQYDAVDAAINPKGDPPDGLLAHSARFDGDTLKVLDIWESPSAFARLGPPEKKDHVSLARFMMQLLWMIPSSVDRAELEGLDAAEVKRREALSDLRRRALSFLEQKENRR